MRWFLSYSRTVWRETYERTTDGRPYSGKFRTAVGETCGLPLRKVIAIPYGVRRTTDSRGRLSLQWEWRFADSHDVIPTPLEPCMSTHRTNAPRRDRIILREARASCTAYTAFQEADRVGFVESHGRFLRREAGGSFWGWRDEHPGRSSWFRPSSTEEADLMRFENAKRFLHIDSYVRLQQYSMARGV